MKVQAKDIVRDYDSDPNENPWVHGKPQPENIEVVPYDRAWPERYLAIAEQIKAALGATVLQLEHIGSTAVPGLAAKPVIDIDLTVPDPTDEAAYVPALESLGFDLYIREPSWHQHRCLRLNGPRVNLHVFGPDCPESIRHLMFRDWLRTHPEDRALYEQAKQSSLDNVEVVMDYNKRKEPVVREIYHRLFQEAGLI
ncbi:GrpB family protein [bacterium]|nr:GrpB family protein [bacterium]